MCSAFTLIRESVFISRTARPPTAVFVVLLNRPKCSCSNCQSACWQWEYLCRRHVYHIVPAKFRNTIPSRWMLRAYNGMSRTCCTLLITWCMTSRHLLSLTNEKRMSERYNAQATAWGLIKACWAFPYVQSCFYSSSHQLSLSWLCAPQRTLGEHEAFIV
jgi:hypothetical protein